MINPRHSHAAILLPDGKVLVVGGHVVPDFPTDSAELFDPDTGTWTAIANMHAPRELINGFLQPDGKVLVLGSSGGDPQSVELYDPASGTWTAHRGLVQAGHKPRIGHVAAGWQGPPDRRRQHGRAVRPGNRVLERRRAHAPAACDPRPSCCSMAPSSWRVASDCLDGVCVATGSAELYVPAGVAPPPLPAFPTPPPPVIPTPTPRPTPYPPATGPVPPNARPWTVTVVNDSSATRDAVPGRA